MRGSRFTETQIVRILKEAEAGRPVKEVCREHGVSIMKACMAQNLSRSVYAYRSRPRDDNRIIEALTSLADKHPRYGFA